MNSAATNNQQVVQVAASRPICPSCATAIKNGGAATVSPLKKVAQVQENSVPYMDPNLKH